MFSWQRPPCLFPSSPSPYPQNGRIGQSTTNNREKQAKWRQGHMKDLWLEKEFYRRLFFFSGRCYNIVDLFLLSFNSTSNSIQISLSCGCCATTSKQYISRHESTVVESNPLFESFSITFNASKFARQERVTAPEAVQKWDGRTPFRLLPPYTLFRAPTPVPGRR